MRIADTPIEPVRKTRDLPLTPDRAFALFIDRMIEWWPVGSHSIAGEDVVDLRIEGHVGGRLLEVARDGSEHAWAHVHAWDPPDRVVFSWHPNIAPEVATVLELRFEPQDGGTRLTLEHRGWEELGAEDGEVLRADYDAGWEIVLSPLDELATRER